MVGDNTDALYTVEVPAPPAADLTADGLGVNVVLSSPRLDLVTPPARADFEADALEVSVALSSAAIRTEPVTGRVRRVRYGFHVPAAAGLPEWSFWNGDGPVTIDGRVYETGQFASHDDAAEPVSSFVSGELEAVFGTRLVFSPHGVFEAWLPLRRRRRPQGLCLHHHRGRSRRLAHREHDRHRPSVPARAGRQQRNRERAPVHEPDATGRRCRRS